MNVLEEALINGFSDILKDEQKPKKSIIQGTVKVVDGEKYVVIDGATSSMLTPIIEGTDVMDGDRVLLTIEDHKAYVTSNITSPASARTATNFMDFIEGDEEHPGGLVIGDLTGDSEFNTLISNDAYHIRKGEEIIASFRTEERIISEDKTHKFTNITSEDNSIQIGSSDEEIGSTIGVWSSKNRFSELMSNAEMQVYGRDHMRTGVIGLEIYSDDGISENISANIMADHIIMRANRAIDFYNSIYVHNVSSDAEAQVHATGNAGDIFLTSQVPETGDVGIWATPSNTGVSTWISHMNHNGTIFHPTSSDKRLKNHIEELSDHEAEVLLNKLKPQTFTYKEDSEGEEILNGFYAQDLKNILSDNEIGYRGYLNIMEKDDDGRYSKQVFDLDTPEEDVRYSIDYAKLVPVLWKGWQMNHEKICKLEQENAELRNRLLKIEEMLNIE